MSDRQVGTDLYRWIVSDEAAARSKFDGSLMREVWFPTPFVVDFYVGAPGSDRNSEIRHWCNERFGREAWPIHGKLGRWQMGGATINGFGWIGFDTDEAMQEFLNHWSGELSHWVKGAECGND